MEDFAGPVMFVGNHPNSLIDPAMVFMITDRQVTFLAREPLFRVPVLGWILRGRGRAAGVPQAGSPGPDGEERRHARRGGDALKAQKAITIFPEGKSHSDPQLSDIKTGCARIALKAVRGGPALRIIPIGLTYAQKHLFRSRVHVEVGEPILVQAVGELTERPSRNGCARSPPRSARRCAR